MAFDDFEPPYDRYAAAYRDWWGPVIAPSAVRLLDSVGVPAGDTACRWRTLCFMRWGMPSLEACAGA